MDAVAEFGTQLNWVGSEVDAAAEFDTQLDWVGSEVVMVEALRCRRRSRTTSFWLSYKICICYIGAGETAFSFHLRLIA